MSNKVTCQINTRGVVSRETLTKFLYDLLRDVERGKQVFGSTDGISFMVMNETTPQPSGD